MISMKNYRLFVLLLEVLIASPILAGEPLGWISFSQTKYVSSPGLEACYQFHPRVGLNAGISTYFQYPEPGRITSQRHEAGFGFYSANLGFSGSLFRVGKHGLGLIAGFKLYYGPDFRKLHYYTDREYYIYYDASSFKPDYGLDTGIFYSFGRLSLLGKFDFARNRVRIGFGYRFGNLKTGE